MDKLKLAFSIVAKRVKEKRSTGEVPVFLGPRGMLALMYDRIAQFSKCDSDDQTEYVLDLAVMAMFAFSTVLPDMEFDDDDTRNTDEEPLLERTNEGPTSEDEESEGTMVPETNDDPRWTPVNPGDPIRSATPVEETNGDDDSE